MGDLAVCLKSCPFGGTDVNAWCAAGSDGKEWYVQSSVCRIGPYYSRQLATAAWNHRPLPSVEARPSSSEMVEKVADIILKSGVGSAYICDDPEEAERQDALEAASEIASLYASPQQEPSSSDVILDWYDETHLPAARLAADKVCAILPDFDPSDPDDAAQWMSARNGAIAALSALARDGDA